MSNDLTRWNRAGLTRFRYIDGNAAVWLETLRQSLARDFPEWKAIQGNPLDDVETMEAQYQAERGDLLWEITRAFARASHVLTEHIDHYANEGYIRTTTQWEHLRRLVEILDYHPSPPASASTPLVLLVKEDNAGTVDEGFKVKYAPQDGGNSVVFETLEDIDVSDELNELRLSGWNSGAGSLEEALGETATSLWIADGDVSGLLQGQVVIVEETATEAGIADSIASLDQDSGAITLAGTDWYSFDLATAWLLLKPLSVKKPWLNGDGVIEFSEDHSLVAGNVIRWYAGSWTYAQVLAVDGRRIRIDSDTLPDGDDIYRVYEVQQPTDGSEFLVADTGAPMVYFDTSGNQFASVTTDDYDPISVDVEPDDDTDGKVVAYSSSLLQITNPDIDVIYLSPENVLPVGSASPPDPSVVVFYGGHGKLGGGDWVVLEDAGGSKTAYVVDAITEYEDTFSVMFEEAPPEGGIVRMYGPFKYRIQAQGATENQTPLTIDQLDELTLALDSLPDELGIDRKLVICQDNGDSISQAQKITVTSVNATTRSFTFTPALASDAGFTLGNTLIYGNVVNAGHGERQPDRVLGSGDATKSNQEFEFKNTDASFVADTSMETGVRADIDITIDQQTWEQVSTLNDSGATDFHYTVRMTEDGYLTIGFGDGTHGRRLPTGNNNVRIAWRKGAGLTGNLAEDSLIKPVKPHYLIDQVLQPLEASGGGDMEAVSSLRETAPASVLTLKRAVSVTDFKNLIAAHSSVWQANAFRLADKTIRGEKVEVVVVPAGGGDLDAELQSTLASYLQNYAVPGVTTVVSQFEPIIITLAVTVRVKSDEYDAESVKLAVAESLLDKFKLENRGLGQALYRAALYEAVEAIEGVENSDCIITGYDGSPSRVLQGDTGLIRVIEADQRQVIYVDDDGLGITVQYQEYSL